MLLGYELLAGAHPVVLRHQPRLATGSVVRVDNTLTRDTIEHAYRIPNRCRRHLFVTRTDGEFGLLDVGSRCGPEGPVPDPSLLSYSNSLLC
jgi:hypothetical protein